MVFGATCQESKAVTIHTREIGKSGTRRTGDTVVHLRQHVRLHDAGDLTVALEQFEQPPLHSPVLLSRDTALRWKNGERLNHAFEQVCLRFGDNDAIVTDTVTLTYDELNRRANQVARHLIAQGVTAGDRVGLLFDKTAETYVALLAVLKVNAAYVPLDPGFPAERIRFILGDANIKTIVSMSAFADTLDTFDVRSVLLDGAKHKIDARPGTRLTETEVAAPVDQLCYICLLYTSPSPREGLLSRMPSSA